jgi:uracil-DNA glycosylase
MSGSEPARAVYYEDLAVPKSSKENANLKETTDINGHSIRVESKTTATTTSLKRQRTLVDMFIPSAKKSKLGQSSGSQTLNSIPFSLSEYINSLTEEEQSLLGLECECMGKSW